MTRNDPNSPPTVAILGTRGYPSYYGGFETAVRELAPALADDGWKVTVYGRPSSTREDDPTCDPRIVRKITRGLNTRSLSTITYGLTSALHTVRTKPDVALIMNCANGLWLPLLRLRGIPTLVNVDGIEWERAKWGKLAKLVFFAGARLTARFANGIVCDAKAIVSRWKTQFSVTGTFIPYGGHEPAETLPIEPGLTDRGYALAVARFVPENSIPEFIKAAERIAENHDVVIVGSSGYGGPLEDAVSELTERVPRVRWLGHLNDDRRLHSLWQHAGAYFHGHSVGGTNPALVQAMFCGAPVVARDTVYNREVLGESGVFVEPEPISIASAVTRVLEDADLRDELIAASITRAREEYTWKGVCDAYSTALSLLARPDADRSTTDELAHALRSALTRG